MPRCGCVMSGNRCRQAGPVTLEGGNFCSNCLLGRHVHDIGSRVELTVRNLNRRNNRRVQDVAKTTTKKAAKAAKGKASDKTARVSGAERPWPRWYVYSTTKAGERHQANTYLSEESANDRARELRKLGMKVVILQKDGPTRAANGEGKKATAKPGRPGRKPGRRAKPAAEPEDVEEPEAEEADEGEDA
jgi:hypothetical protein